MTDTADAAYANQELEKLIDLLPERFRYSIRQLAAIQQLVEVVLDLGRPPVGRFLEGARKLSDIAVSQADLSHATDRVNDFGVDNRAGINGTLHRVSCMRNRDGNIVGVTLRVGRAVSGSAQILADILFDGRSVLLLGRPGVGKTTCLRDCARIISETHSRRVVIVDPSNEIAGDGDVAHSSLQHVRRLQVPPSRQLHEAMIEAVENHTPQCIVVDEIGTEEATAAARTIAQRGVQLIATAHGSKLENLMKNPTLSALIGGIEAVTLGDQEAGMRGVQKTTLERSEPATFDVCVEIVSRSSWRVHRDVNLAVDRILSGLSAGEDCRSVSANDLQAGAPAVPPEFAVRPWDLPNPSVPLRTLCDAEVPSAVAPLSSRQRPLGLPVQPQELPPPPSSTGDTSPTPASIAALAAAAAVQAPENAPFVFLHGIEASDCVGALRATGLLSALRICDRVQDADAIVTLRSLTKKGDWAVMAGRLENIPVFALKSGSRGNLTLGIRAVLGLESTHSTAPKKLAPIISTARDEDIGSLSAGSAPGQDPAAAATLSTASTGFAAEALEELRIAVEKIVMPRGRPVELSRRSLSVLKQQVEMVQSMHGVIGQQVGTLADGTTRLRILSI